MRQPASRILAVPSLELVTTEVPSGEKTAECTKSLWPDNVSSHYPLLPSQILAVRSWEAVRTLFRLRLTSCNTTPSWMPNSSNEALPPARATLPLTKQIVLLLLSTPKRSQVNDSKWFSVHASSTSNCSARPCRLCTQTRIPKHKNACACS